MAIVPQSPDHKQCSKCEEWFPRTPEFWDKRKNSRDGYRNICKRCRVKYINQWRLDNPDKRHLEHQRYYQKNKDRINEKSSNRYYKNPKKKYDYIIQYRIKNKDKHKQQTQNYYLQNRNSINEKHKKYRQENAEKEKSRHILYKKSHPEKTRLGNHIRRIKQRGNGGSYTQKELQTQFESQGRRCFHCGKFISLTNSKTCHIDHWIPISRGGSNNIDNIRLLCPYCNLSKGAKLPYEWSSRYNKDGNIS